MYNNIQRESSDFTIVILIIIKSGIKRFKSLFKL